MTCKIIFWLLARLHLIIFYGNNGVNCKNFQARKRQFFPHKWSDCGFKGTSVNWAWPSLNGSSCEITTTTINNYLQLLYREVKGILLHQWFPRLILPTKTSKAQRGMLFMQNWPREPLVKENSSCTQFIPFRYENARILSWKLCRVCDFLLNRKRNLTSLCLGNHKLVM